MVKQLLFLLALVCCTGNAHGQSYDWIKGGGSSEDLPVSAGPYEHVTCACTDTHGNTYITAVVGGTNILADTFYMNIANNAYPGVTHILLASYNCNGAMRWAKLIESYDYANAGGLAYSDGSVYLVGNLVGGNKHIGYDTVIASSYLGSFTARFDTAGRFKWIRFIGADSLNTELHTLDQGYLAIDGQGYIHNFNIIKAGLQIMTGVVTGSTGTYDLKYDSLGSLLSANHIPALDSAWYIYNAVYNKLDNKLFAVLGANSEYWPAHHTTSYNTAICAIRPDESMIWIDTSGEGCGITGVDYKGGNALYICGLGNYPDTFSIGGITIADTVWPGYQLAAIFRLDTNGVARWAYDLQSNEDIDGLDGITILPGGLIAASGQVTDSSIHGRDTLISDANDPLLVIVDSSGNTVKLDRFHGTGGLDAFGNVITSDAVGNLYIGGTLDHSMYAGSLAPYVTNGGSTDFFLVKYGYSCSCTAAPLAAFSYTGTTTVSFTYTGTAGYDSLRWDFGDGATSTLTNPIHTYTTRSEHHACVTIFTSCGDSKYCCNINNTAGLPSGASSPEVSIYPNPATDELFIDQAETGASIKLFNTIGAQVYNGVIHSSRETIDIKGLLPGMYILQITGKDVNRYVGRFVKN